MNSSLPVGWQHVFPSPVYPSLQEHLNEPSVFEHDARLWRQSSDPCTHSSTSKNDKENRLFPAKILGKSDAMRRKKRTKTRQSKKSYETCLFVLIACLLVLSWCTISGADPGFFLGGGALVSCSPSNTNKPHSFFLLQNTSCIRKAQVISRGAGGVRTPCTHPLDPPRHIMMSQLMASLQMERESSEKERKKDQSVLLKRVR